MLKFMVITKFLKLRNFAHKRGMPIVDTSHLLEFLVRVNHYNDTLKMITNICRKLK